MGKYLSLPDCIRLAEFAHFHALDSAGFPYIDHPKRVLTAVQQLGASPYVQCAAILHDTTEDTDFTAQMLLDLGVLPAAVEIINLVDRHESERIFTELYKEKYAGLSTDEWRMKRDEFYYVKIRERPGANLLKKCDIGDNTLPWRVEYLPERKQKHNHHKYFEVALPILNFRSDAPGWEFAA